MASSRKEAHRERLRKMMRTEKSLKCLHDNVSSNNPRSMPAPSLVWREQVSQWCYDVIDHLDASREAVYIAMNILDRYVVKCSATELMDKVQYEQAAITSLFLASKISTSLDLKMQDLLCLSRNALESRDIITTGKKILETLSFDRRILTPQSFVKIFLGLLPSSAKSRAITSWMDFSIYLVELSVCDGNFSYVSPSELAFASILVAMKKDREHIVNRKTFDCFAQVMLKESGIDFCSTGIRSLSVRLQNIYIGSQEFYLATSPNVIEEEEDVVRSTNQHLQTPEKAALR